MFPIIDLGFIQIPTFFVILSMLMGLAFFITIRRAVKMKMNPIHALDLALVLVVFAIVGARLGHVILEQWDYYLNDPLKILFFWEGGFVFYGGFILSLTAGILFVLWKKRTADLKEYFRLYTPILSFSYAFGRIGCFLEGCCYGKACQLAWSVNGRHPTQLYSSAWEFGVLFFLLGYEKNNEKSLSKNPEKLFFIWLLFHSVGRALTEIWRDDFRGNAPLVSVSTWLSFLWIAVSIGYFSTIKNMFTIQK